MLNDNLAVRTRTVARIVGPYLLIVAVALFLRRSSLADFFLAFMRNDSLVFAAGAFTLMAGFSLFVAHHHWNSVSAVLISLIAVAASVKGASLMIASEWGSQLTNDISSTPSIILGAIVLEALAGAWLTVAGWRPLVPPPLPT